LPRPVLMPNGSARSTLALHCTTPLLNGSTMAQHCSSSRCIALLIQLTAYHSHSFQFVVYLCTTLKLDGAVTVPRCCSMVLLRSTLALQCTTPLLNGSPMAEHCSSSRCFASLCQIPVYHHIFGGVLCTPLRHHEATRMSNGPALRFVVSHWWAMLGRTSALHRMLCTPDDELLHWRAKVALIYNGSHDAPLKAQALEIIK